MFLMKMKETILRKKVPSLHHHCLKDTVTYNEYTKDSTLKESPET